MSHPTWLTRRVLADAATAMATARQSAVVSHARGRDHRDDPAWCTAVAEARRATAKAEEIGINLMTALDASKGTVARYTLYPARLEVEVRGWRLEGAAGDHSHPGDFDRDAEAAMTWAEGIIGARQDWRHTRTACGHRWDA
ncbi:hypothetical protein ACQEVS_33025 [Streptomyces sp. CA-181903]|uniref:hypothetical protein n=1 Tax=Streptomyces sp. CA-181903 TaxID=3240055 RepID=UPI003D94E8FC